MVRQLFAQLSRETFVYGLSSTVAKLVGFVLVPLYTRALTRSDFGILDLITTGTGILGSLLILGLDNALALTFYRAEATEERRVIVSTFLYFELGLLGVTCAVLFALAGGLALLLFGSPALTADVQLAIATVPFATFVTIFLDIARLARLPRRYLVLSTGSLLLTAVLILVAVVGLGLGVTGVLGATLLGNASFCLVGWALTRPHYTRAFSPRLLRRMLGLGLPLVPVSVAFWVINFSNRWFLFNLGSADQVAILAFATKLCAPVVLVVTAFQTAWVPFSLSIARQDAAETVYARTLLYFLAVSLGTLLLLTIAADPLIRILATPAYLPAMPALAPVGLSSIAYGAYYIVATGVNLTGRTIHIGWTTLIAAGANIALNLALIPALGIVGAALAGLGANLIPVILLYTVAQRLHYVPYDLPRAVLLAGLSAAFLAGAVLLPGQGAVLDFALRAALLLGFVATLFGLGIVRPQHFHMLMRKLRGAAGLGGAP